MDAKTIIANYGSVGKTGRIIFAHYAYILIAKKLGKEWRLLTKTEKLLIKSDMIDEYAGTKKTILGEL